LIPRYELVVGRALFRHIFALVPQAVGMYSFGEIVKDTADSRDGSPIIDIPEEMYELPSFQQHAMGVVATLGSVIMMMTGESSGLSDLAEALVKLGNGHVAYGVQASHYRILETALLRTLQEIGGEELWTETVRKGWAAVFKFITQTMQAGAMSRVEIIHDERKTTDSPSPVLRMKIHSTQFVPSCEPLQMPCWPENDDTKSVSSSSADTPPILPRRRADTVRASSGSPLMLPKLTTDETKTRYRTILAIHEAHDDSKSCTVSGATETAYHEHPPCAVGAR
jgi:hemoglobin-like flavoprotein